MLIPSRTEYPIPKSDVKKTFDMLPLNGLARNHSVDSKWFDSIYESIKYLGNTSKGAHRREVCSRICKDAGIYCKW